MLSAVIRTSLALLIVNQLLVPSEALRNKGSGAYSDPGKVQPYAGTSSGLPSQNTTRRGLGISAWGIVGLIVGLILAGVGFYYFSICYPIICTKERHYDIMKLDSV